MGTHCTIAIVDADNSVRSIYCHWDGYPAGVGQMLTTHYTTSDIINQLIDLGNISTLGSDIHTSTEAYMRDRHEHDQHHSVHISRGAWLSSRAAEYNYVFYKNTWHTYTSDGALIEITIDANRWQSLIDVSTT